MTRGVGGEHSIALRGSCFGYSVHAAMPFRYLRQAGGEEPLHITQVDGLPGERGALIVDWPATENDHLGARLWARGSGYRLDVEGVGEYTIDPRDRLVKMTKSAEPRRREASLLGLPLLLCFLQRGDLPLHAAAVDVDGSAVLLAAPGRSGKTTLAAAFHQAGYRVVAEDISCCRITPSLALLPGPALLRIRRDVQAHLDLSDTDVVAEDRERLYIAIDEGRKGDAKPLPIRGVVLLEAADEAIRLERLGLPEALPQLWALNFQLPGDAARAAAFRGLTTLAQTGVWRLRRPLSFGRLPEVVRVIVRTCVPA